MHPVRPQRYHEYIDERHFGRFKEGRLWEEFRPIVPFAIIDSRIIDLAISFWDNPDEKLLTGYRRLEDAVRERTGLSEHGSKLFRQAFQPSSAKLTWKGLDSGERAARADLFASAYSAHRNPRAHKEMKSDRLEQLSEFLLLNGMLSKSLPPRPPVLNHHSRSAS
jgi:hypothetical protein